VVDDLVTHFVLRELFALGDGQKHEDVVEDLLVRRFALTALVNLLAMLAGTVQNKSAGRRSWEKDKTYLVNWANYDGKGLPVADSNFTGVLPLYSPVMQHTVSGVLDRSSLTADERYFNLGAIRRRDANLAWAFRLLGFGFAPGGGSVGGIG